MVDVLRRHARVEAFDIEPHAGLDGTGNFLDRASVGVCGGVVTNPPFDMATEFIEHALRITEPVGGFVAMLLRTDFDHARSRTHLFRDCPAFARKIVLTRRIVWFVEPNGRPKKSPSVNHAWFLWNWKQVGPATLAYAAWPLENPLPIQ
jgi:hypothetical protein